MKQSPKNTGRADGCSTRPGKLPLDGRLRTVRRVVGVPEPVRRQLRTGVRDIRIDVPFAAAVKRASCNLAPALWVPARGRARRAASNAPPPVAGPALDARGRVR